MDRDRDSLMMCNYYAHEKLYYATIVLLCFWVLLGSESDHTTYNTDDCLVILHYQYLSFIVCLTQSILHCIMGGNQAYILIYKPVCDHVVCIQDIGCRMLPLNLNKAMEIALTSIYGSMYNHITIFSGKILHFNHYRHLFTVVCSQSHTLYPYTQYKR